MSGGAMMMTFSSRRRLLPFIGFLTAFIAVMSVSTFALYRRAKVHLDHELGERLLAIATTIARAVEFSPPESLRPGNVDGRLLTTLYLVRAENQLSNIVILTGAGRTVVDLSGASVSGGLNPFLDLDYGAVTLARSGIPAYTNLYRSGGIYMKSAYAPVLTGDDEVTGIVGVEAGAEFFAVLRALTRGILLVGAASAAVVVVLSVFFYRVTRSLDHAHAAILQGENLATMGRMVAGVAHEIRNPLSIIKTSAERLAKRYNPKDEAFAYISEEVDELNRILTGYLNFAKSERDRPRPHSIQRIVKRCLLILEGEIHERRLNVAQDFPPEDAIVMADDKRVQQAVLNVLINAFQAVDDGGNVEISLHPSAKTVTVEIKDDGVGIGERELKEVLKPFYTTKKDGSGLGLSIVKSVVEEHRGSLEIRSEQGKGTVVSISLPRA
jgi:signal transduction histidine kinase